MEVTLGGWIVTYIIEVRGGGPSSGYISSGFFGGLTFGRVALLWVNSKVVWLFFWTESLANGIQDWRTTCNLLVLLVGVRVSTDPPPSPEYSLERRLEVVIWRVPSLIGNAVTVSIVGVLVRFETTSGVGPAGHDTEFGEPQLGPIYPIVMNHAARTLPHWLLTGRSPPPTSSHSVQPSNTGSHGLGSIGWIAGLGQAGSAAIPFMTGALAASLGIWTLHPL